VRQKESNACNIVEKVPRPQQIGRQDPEKMVRMRDASKRCARFERGLVHVVGSREIATTLKRSAGRSKRRKAEPFRSALSMLTFYINRGGKNLPESRKRVLERAKVELRRQFGRA
jgi:hypothetical protein